MEAGSSVTIRISVTNRQRRACISDWCWLTGLPKGGIRPSIAQLVSQAMVPNEHLLVAQANHFTKPNRIDIVKRWLTENEAVC